MLNCELSSSLYLKTKISYSSWTERRSELGEEGHQSDQQPGNEVSYSRRHGRGPTPLVSNDHHHTAFPADHISYSVMGCSAEVKSSRRT